MSGEPLSTGASPCRASKQRGSVRPRNGPFSATWPPHALWHGIASYAFLDESRPARQSNGLTDLGHGDRCHWAGEGAEVLHGPNRAGRGRPAAAPFRCTPTSRPRWARCRGCSLRRRACTRWCISAPIWGPLPQPDSASILPLRGTGSAHSTIPMETFFGVRLIEITKVGLDFRV